MNNNLGPAAGACIHYGLELPLSTGLGGGSEARVVGLHIESCRCAAQEGLCCAGEPLISHPLCQSPLGMGSTRSVCLYCTEREQDAPEERPALERSWLWPPPWPMCEITSQHGSPLRLAPGCTHVLIGPCQATHSGCQQGPEFCAGQWRGLQIAQGRACEVVAPALTHLVSTTAFEVGVKYVPHYLDKKTEKQGSKWLVHATRSGGPGV